MIPKKQVTEEDIKLTEERLASSFRGLKESITRAPSDAVKPVTDTVKAHPFITIGAALGVGIIAFRAIMLLTPRTRIINREIVVRPQVEVKELHKKSVTSDLMSQAIALAYPYLMAYLKNELSRFTSGGRRDSGARQYGQAAAPDVEQQT